MADAPAPRHRPSFGIFEAATLLVLAGAALWLVRPVPGARAAAEAEKAVLLVLGAVADAEDRLPPGGPFLPLPDLAARDPAAAAALAGYSSSGVDGVLGNGTYWMTVLLPDREGILRGPPSGDRSGAARGYAVLAWPRRRASPLLRSLAALPGGKAWQRADGMEESGLPAEPPVPRAAFPPDPDESAVPPPPPDWVETKGRRGGG